MMYVQQKCASVLPFCNTRLNPREGLPSPPWKYHFIGPRARGLMSHFSNEETQAFPVHKDTPTLMQVIYTNFLFVLSFLMISYISVFPCSSLKKSNMCTFTLAKLAFIIYFLITGISSLYLSLVFTFFSMNVTSH